MADDTISIGPGRAVYPRLSTPDTKFDELGQYKADVAVPLKEAEPHMEILQARHKAHTGKPAKKSENTMWIFETDEAGEETGNVIFKIRVKNRLRKDGQVWDRKPKQFDATLRPIDVNPYGGSTYIVSASIYEWAAGDKKGISLQPLGVQILELVEGGGPSAAGMGFAAQAGYAGIASVEDEDEDDGDAGDVSDDEDDDDAEDGDY